jgi:16S rRNA (guanine966-N2)-methyltransferase
MAETRITGGELGGRRLYVPKAGVRPTTGMLREAIFSMLGSVDGMHVLDLFAGSGSLGIEALSRGAREATFVDRDTAAVSRNLRELRLDELDVSAAVERSDVTRWLKRVAERPRPPSFDLVLCDPPYRLAAALGGDLSAALPRIAGPGAKLVLETSTRKPLELGLALIKEREYGDTLLRIHSLSEEGT